MNATDNDVRALYAFVKARVYKHEDAEDIVQSTLERAVRYAHGFRGECKYTTWLCSIAIRVIHNFWKAGKDTDFEQIIDDLDGEDGDEPYDILLKKQQTAELNRALGMVDMTTKKAIQLIMFADRPYQEVADELHIPVGTVKSKVCRAGITLSQFIKP